MSDEETYEHQFDEDAYGLTYLKWYRDIADALREALELPDDVLMYPHEFAGYIKQIRQFEIGKYSRLFNVASSRVILCDNDMSVQSMILIGVSQRISASSFNLIDDVPNMTVESEVETILLTE